MNFIPTRPGDWERAFVRAVLSLLPISPYIICLRWFPQYASVALVGTLVCITQNQLRAAEKK